MAIPSELTGSVLVLITAIILFSIFASILFVRYWSHTREREPIIFITTVIGLSLALGFCSCALSIDSFLVSASSNKKLGVKFEWADSVTMTQLNAVVSLLYHLFFSGLLIFTTITVPFVYFFFEERDDESISLSTRISIATRYTFAVTIILAIVLTCGLLLRPSHPLPPNTPINWDFLKNALIGNGFESVLLFVLALAMILGMVVFVLYTAPGLFLFPIHLLKPVQPLSRELRVLNSELERVSVSIDNLRLEFPDPRSMPSTEYRRFENLQEEKQLVELKIGRIQATSPAWYKTQLTILLFPFKVACFTLSVCIIMAIFSTLFTRPPDCPSCPRLVLPITSSINPIDLLLQRLAHVSPINHMTFALILVYTFCATFYGIRAIGIRILWIKLFTLRPYKTMPQGLLIVSVLLILAMLSLMWEMTSVIAPSYATWGSQRYCPTLEDKCRQDPLLVRFCDLSASTKVCTPTALSLILARIALSTPALSAIFFWAQPASIAVAMLALAYGVLSGRSSRVADFGEDDLNDLDELTDEERTRLLGPS